jgi:hypothetical protein
MSDQAEEQSLEERMLDVLEAEDPTPEEELEEGTEELTEGTEEETEEEESDEEQPTATVKLKVNGEEIDKPLEEVIALAQQGIDYTQKTQKVADERKQLEEQVQTLKVQEQQFQQHMQSQQALLKDVARLTALDDQLSAYQNVNWDAIPDEDPVRAQKLFFQYNQLQTQRGQMANTLADKQAQLAQEQQAKIGKTIEENVKILQKDIPAWNTDLYNNLMKHVVDNYGITPHEAAITTDARLWKVIHKAYLYDQLQANPAVKQKISEAKPIIRPGAKDSKQQANTQTRALRDKLRSTGDGAIAQKLIEGML